MSVMHLWCFVLACKKTGYWTRRAVLIIASEAEEYADPHTKTHTEKKSATSRGFVVSSCWLPFPNARRNKLPTVAFFLHFARSIAFFLHFARPIAFFYFLPVTSLFFLHCVCHIAFFFALCPFHRFFFYTLPVTSLFFCTLSVTSHVFCNLVVASFFFCNPLSQLHFFCSGKIGDPSVAFFLQDVSASLDCCNSGCISVCTFAFILHFFRFFPYFFTL